MIYKSFEFAKNGTNIPVFLSGKTMESRYNPERDADSLCNTINETFSFFLVLGIGSGIFIQKLSEKYPEAKIIGVELEKEDLDFLSTSELIQKIKNNKSIHLTYLENLETILSQTYMPAKHGELKIIEQRAWINENQSKIEKINYILQKSLGIISADYSVQAHFGKLWTFNILNNVRLAQFSSFSINADLNKTAVIVAAGPSLDKNLSILKERDKYFIISTDTAGSTLHRYGIIPDILISIDGQNVSFNHFINSNSVLYAFDLCANFSAAKHIYESGNQIMFFSSGHPLANAINVSCGNRFPCIFSGAGTVTITALDFAVKTGFKNILILGADFSYSNGKPYASGTYLDALYNSSSSKISSSEKNFSKLMFRTELIKSEKKMTTQILEAYKLSMEKYMQSRNIIFRKENDIYFLNCSSDTNENFPLQGNFINLQILSSFFKKLKESSPEEAELLLLPYIAWLRNNKKYKFCSYSELLKLAFNNIVRYNI